MWGEVSILLVDQYILKKVRRIQLIWAENLGGFLPKKT